MPRRHDDGALLSDVLAIGSAMLARQRSAIRSDLLVVARQQAIKDYMEAIEMKYDIHQDGEDVTPRPPANRSRYAGAKHAYSEATAEHERRAEAARRGWEKRRG